MRFVFLFDKIKLVFDSVDRIQTDYPSNIFFLNISRRLGVS